MQGQKLVNIPASIQDPLYRYKRPVCVTKVEGSGNGIKTNLVNLPEVATYIRCSEDCNFTIFLDTKSYGSILESIT